MTEDKWASPEDFAVLFLYHWYRDFPIDKLSTGAKRADWTIHIGIVVRRVGDLLGFVTRFEHGGRTDAILRSTDGDEIAVEWEWTKGYINELKKMKDKEQGIWSKITDSDRSLKYSVLITYSDNATENKQDIFKKLSGNWGGVKYPLLLILINYEKSTEFYSRRKFTTINMCKISDSKFSEFRSEKAVPWEIDKTRWSYLYQNVPEKGK